MCLQGREGARAGRPARRGRRRGRQPPRNGPSRLRRDSAGPCPARPPQPEPRAAAAASAATPAPDAARRLLAVGRAVGLRGRGRRLPPGPAGRRVPALRPGRAPASPAAPAGGRQLLQPPAPAAAAAAAHLGAPRVPGALAQPQPPSRVLAQRLALAWPAAALSPVRCSSGY